MENEATTKTPIPTRSGFRNFAICTLIFAFSISLPSTLVETPLQISLLFRKTNPIPITTKPMQPSLYPVIPTEGTLPACRSGGIYFNTLAISQNAYLTQLTKQSCPALCKTNPILANPKPMQPPLSQGIMKANHPWPLEENEPNRTQSNPISK